MMRFVAFVIAVVIHSESVLHAQTPKFEVATVKANRTPSGGSNLPVLRQGRMIATNVSLLDLLDKAWGFTPVTTSGPDWLSTDRFDVTAGAPQDVPDTELMPML